MRKSFLITVLCVIALMGSACSRHTARAVRKPGDSIGAGAQKRGLQRGDPASGVRDAIRSLKERMGRGGADDTALAGGGSVTVTPPSSGSGSVPQSVGTSGATSVETRYPADPTGPGAQPPQGRGHLLSRAGAAVRGAAGGSWLGIAALLVIACAVIAALVVRRSRTTEA